ncbi:hypothetical protein [Streptomyces yaizuensis]|uniref:Uncharacterized protein n=1 Tax=Streptomyces yaizuensis TaxID=2989713 RepID=A0ABQ5PBJ0_9ACTN|nr:hypothetical protein [Streptomyces sp. YSPA8]GLF99930.1 hypothetical protein SYYSPA8_36555 [Streptomyces sp. YSPA8]
MSNQADEHQLDVLIHRRAPDALVVAESRTGAPEILLSLLDTLGFARHGAAIYVWHELPEDQDPTEISRTCLRAHKALTAARYAVKVDDRLLQQHG